MSIKGILLFILLLSLISCFRKSNVTDPVLEETDFSEAGHFTEHEPQKNPDAKEINVDQRARHAFLINKWITQMNPSKERPTICWWSYKEGSCDTICFSFPDGIEREGKVHFKYDPGLPRVSEMTYVTEDGGIETITGYLSADFTEQMLYLNFDKEKASAQKQSYLNKVAYAAMEEGQADLDILTYQQITEEEFQSMFGEKEMNAFIKMLSLEFDEVSVTEEKHIIRVTPKTVPL